MYVGELGRNQIKYDIRFMPRSAIAISVGVPFNAIPATPLIDF
jgi:hypothetical protein